MNVKKTMWFMFYQTQLVPHSQPAFLSRPQRKCVSVGSLVCALPCVLWLILWLWWAAAVRCETSTSANHFVSQQWWCKCRCAFVTLWEDVCFKIAIYFSLIYFWFVFNNVNGEFLWFCPCERVSDTSECERVSVCYNPHFQCLPPFSIW